MTLAILGPWQMIVVSLVFPVLIFMLGYYVGKKAGYIKRVKEEEGRK